MRIRDIESETYRTEQLMWGMKMNAFKALSARECKRVRNRTSARLFRAKHEGRSRELCGVMFPYYSTNLE